ncbi:MAG: molybdopterin-guanine dinucleotide biosynthesis protein A [Paracoccaceae bacterium]|jgi:molybdopterin-guanine dinucleotide biosynthesis protein A
MPPEQHNICGLLLAGGQSRRMGGGDKCLMTLGGRTLLQRLVDTAAPQVGPLVLNTNSDPALFNACNLPVASDVIDGFAGPLAGVLTGLEWAQANAPDCDWVASFACDAPFAPADLVARLVAAVAQDGADMACATSGGRDHPVFALWPVALAGELRAAVVDEGVRKVDIWTARFKLARADFDTENGDPFFNINRPEDLDAASALMGND